MPPDQTSRIAGRRGRHGRRTRPRPAPAPAGVTCGISTATSRRCSTPLAYHSMFAGFDSSSTVTQVARRPAAGSAPRSPSPTAAIATYDAPDGPARTPAPARRGERDHVLDGWLPDRDALTGLAEHLGRELLAHRTPRSAARSSPREPVGDSVAAPRPAGCRGRRPPGPRSARRRTAAPAPCAPRPGAGRGRRQRVPQREPPLRIGLSSGRAAAAARPVAPAGAPFAAPALPAGPAARARCDRRARRRRRCHGRARQVAWQRAGASRATASASAYVDPRSTRVRISPGQRATTYDEKSPSSPTAHTSAPRAHHRPGTSPAPVRRRPARSGVQRHRPVDLAVVLEQRHRVDALGRELGPDLADPRLGVGLAGEPLVGVAPRRPSTSAPAAFSRRHHHGRSAGDGGRNVGGWSGRFTTSGLSHGRVDERRLDELEDLAPAADVDADLGVRGRPWSAPAPARCPCAGSARRCRR